MPGIFSALGFVELEPATCQPPAPEAWPASPCRVTGGFKNVSTRMKLTLNKPWQPGQSYSFITGRIIARPGFVLTNGCAMAEKPASGSH